MKLGISSRCQPSTVRDSNQALLARSARTTARVSQSQRRRAGITMASQKEKRDFSLRRPTLRNEGQEKVGLLRSKGPGWMIFQVMAWAGAPSISARAWPQRSQIVG